MLEAIGRFLTHCLNISVLENTVTLTFTSNLFLNVKFHSAKGNVVNLRKFTSWRLFVTMSV